MTTPSKHIALAATLAAVLTCMLAACGKKDAAPAPASTAAVPAAQATAPRIKTTEKFGIVSSIDLVPVFALPPKYASYIRQDITEVSHEEFPKLSDAALERYVTTWLTQGASVAQPNWDALAGIVAPATIDEANAFKKQAAVDKVKSSLVADKASLNMAFGWQGEVLQVAGPDVANGEYYLTISPHSRHRIVSYTTAKNYNYSLSYQPDFTALGMQGDRHGDMQLTVKVPIEKAREIESMRESTPLFMRVYGHVRAMKSYPLLRRDLSEAALEVDVEAIEFGVRKAGSFQTLFFLDSDQLKRVDH